MSDEPASVETARATLHMREVQDRCEDALQDVDRAIADLQALIKRGEGNDE